MIGSYLAQTIWWKQRISDEDGYGQPSFASPVQIRGRWLEKRRMVRNAEGEQVISDVSVTLSPEAAVSVGDQLSADGAKYQIVIALAMARQLGGEALVKQVYL